jgi:GNAT superfamily N-acetyltransferase
MVKLEPLTGRHDRKTFDCGDQRLNAWLRQIALQHQNKGISRTVVAAPDCDESAHGLQRDGYADLGSTAILGFYALSAAMMATDSLTPNTARRCLREIPVTRLGCLAVRADMQGQGLGRLLLADAIQRARGAARVVGSAGIFVDAKDAEAARFYAHFGFQPCIDSPLRLDLPMW